MATPTTQSQPKWQRAGDPNDFIGTIGVAHYEIYTEAVQRLFTAGPVPDSGIVISSDNNLADGGRIEKSCYSKGGFKFLIRPHAKASGADTASFPSHRLSILLESLGDLYLAGVVGVHGQRSHLDSCWAVCQRDGDYGTLHNHVPPDGDPDTRYSGMFYVHTPAAINPQTFPNGCLHLITRTGGVVYVPPIPGTVTLWPSPLLHGIHPFRGDGDRLGIAFDIVSKQQTKE